MKYRMEFTVKMISTMEAQTEIEAIQRLKDTIDKTTDTQLISVNIMELGEARTCSCGSTEFYVNNYANKVELECKNCGETHDLH